MDKIKTAITAPVIVGSIPLTSDEIVISWRHS